MNQYFKNQLSEQKEDQITEQLLTNHYDRKLKERWKTILEGQYDVLPPEKTNTKPQRVNLFRIASMAAAVIALLFIVRQVFPTNSQPDCDQLMAQHLAEPYENTSLKKSLSVEDSRTRAANAYSKKNYALTILYYEEVRMDNSSTIDDTFYLGLAYLYNKQASEAVTLLQEAREMPPSANIRSIKIIDWYLSLAYIESKQIASAKSELQKIINDKDGVKKKAARQLLESLDGL